MATPISKSFPINPYPYNFSDPEEYLLRTKKGLSKETICQISASKKEPAWMLEKRLIAYQLFLDKPLPNWGADLSHLDFDQMTYFMRAQEKPSRSWADVPKNIRNTFDRLGVPEAEQKYLAGVGAQYESEVIYHHLEEEWEKQGVIFLDTDSALRQHEQLLQQYFGTIVPPTDNKFAALNTAVWSGGSFLYIPKGVHVTMPLQAYFRINARNAGQFERTLIIAEEDSFVHYVEGCSAPIYSSESLHSAVVEVILKAGARVRYTTIQNWSEDIYNLVTKRAVAHSRASMEWIDCNLGSRATMKYPSVIMVGEEAHSEILSLALAGPKQEQDVGAKVIHLAPKTTSVITSKSVSHGGGHTTYRGLVKSNKKALGMSAKVVCDALLLDEKSRSDTYPTMDIQQPLVKVEHEASVSRLEEDKIFYLRTRGLSESEANTLIINGFLEPIIKELPMEYAVEMNRLIQLQMEDSIG